MVPASIYALFPLPIAGTKALRNLAKQFGGKYCKKKPGAVTAASRPLIQPITQIYAQKPATAGGSSLSGAAEADAHLAVFQQHRHPAIARDEALHLLHGRGILDHILINYGKTLFALGLPGLEGEGSGLLAEDGDFLSHGHLLTWNPENRPSHKENPPD